MGDIKKRGLNSEEKEIKEAISNNYDNPSDGSHINLDDQEIPGYPSPNSPERTTLEMNSLPASSFSPSDEMQPSIMSQESEENSQNTPDSYESGSEYSEYQKPYSQENQNPDYQQAYPQQEQQYPEYSQYQQYQPQSINPDTITEISEQVVDEKLAGLRNQIEKSLDIKNSMESKINYLDERMKRIEKILDRLQLSVLQKVGEYISSVGDIKKEIIETQKSFKAMASHHNSTHHKKKHSK